MNIRTLRLFGVVVFGLLLLSTYACNFSVSTANISAVKLGKDKDVSQETNTFEKSDTIYVVATISNAPDKLKVTGRLAVEDVPGQNTGPIPGLEETLDLPGSGSANFTFSPPAAGWPAGKYKVEILMLNEQGQQKDQKTVSFTVS